MIINQFSMSRNSFDVQKPRQDVNRSNQNKKILFPKYNKTEQPFKFKFKHQNPIQKFITKIFLHHNTKRSPTHFQPTMPTHITNKQSQRHKTSVFSEYENNSNNSISSKQLQLWLQQMAPTSHTSPKFAKDWNLMSTSSRYESDGMTFGARMDTFESANKENILSKANFNIQPQSKPTQETKQNHYQSLSQPFQSTEKSKNSKSYINAMQELQKRAKTLQEENMTMRRSLVLLQEQKKNSLQSSMVESQEMKGKLFQFGETEKKVDEMKKENKRLRDSKNQQSVKIKLMQKSMNEHKSKVTMIEQRLQMLSKENESLKHQLSETNNMAKSLLTQNKQLVMKTETLENMKEKSTNSILQKYAKALERIEELELTVGENKNRSNAIEEKNKKVFEEKDAKYLASLETINKLKLEKEQLSMRVENLSMDIEEKSKKNYSLKQSLGEFEHSCSEKNKQISNLKNLLEQKDQKLSRLAEKYAKLESKYATIKGKLKNQEQKHQKQIRLIKENVKKIQDENQSINQSLEEEQESEQDLQNQNKMSELIQQKHPLREQQTPVERYDQESLEYDNHTEEIEEFKTLAKPLSIIINAKKERPRIKSQEDDIEERSYLQDRQESSEQDDDSTLNEKYIQRKSNANKTISFKKQKQNLKEEKKQSNRKSISLKASSQEKTHKPIQQPQPTTSRKNSTSRQPKSRSKESVKSSNSRKQSSKEPKYLVPSLKSQKSNSKKTKSFTNNSAVLSYSQNRSKTSSVERKRSNEKSSVSVTGSKNNSFVKNKEQTCEHSAQRYNAIMVKSTDPSQSRYVNDRPYQEHMYMSAQPTRYPSSSHPDHYYYTNEINHPHNISNLTHPTNNSALNKALLLQYQQEALKLYEEHEMLLAMSEDESKSTQEKAEILGRIRQVMSMIDHNTDKIFSIKGRVE